MHRRGNARHQYQIIILVLALIFSAWIGIPSVEGTGGTFGGGDGSAGNPYVIEDVWDLQNMSHSVNANYTLGNDIDASDTVNWNSGAGFVPVGTKIIPFVGSLDGRNHTISGLFIDRPTTDHIGLIGYMQKGSSVKDVGLADVNVTGGSCTGALLGFFNQGSLSGSFSSGKVTGAEYPVGGLVGYITRGTMDRCHSTAIVKGTNVFVRYGGVGGLIGRTHQGIVTRSYATGDVIGMRDNVGGLIGDTGATVDHCYATGDVIGGGNWTGGLIGRHDNADVSYCYATGNVTGDRYVGGLCGSTWGGTVSDSYATSNVSGRDVVGGFSGREATGITSNCYSTGNVTGNTSVGGFVGYFDRRAWIPNCHYNVDDVWINGDHHLTIGGLFDAQYDDWIGSNLSLNISDYDTTLVPAVGLSKTYDVSSIQGLVDLQGFAEFEDYTFRLATDIDLSTAPGLYVPYIVAEFDGMGHNISNLHLDMPFASCLGMFGSTMVNTVRNLGVIDCYVVGAEKVGGIVGSMSGEMVSRSFVTGTVVGIEEVGGLAGYGTGTESYASVNVTGVSYVGGFAGRLTNGPTSVYPENAYATGSVTGDTAVGGFAGRNACLITNCYSTGRVTGNKYVGGLTGEWGASAIECFWDVETSGQNESMRGTGLTTAEMKRRSTFTDAGWDFTDVWCMIDNVTYPLFRWQDTGLPVADAGPDLTIDVGTRVTFDGSGSRDETGMVYKWSFVDGSPVTLRGVRPEYRFEAPGTFPVTLSVTDCVGNWDSDVMTVTVNENTAPIADAGADQTVDQGTVVTFDGSGSWANGGVVNLTWSVVDGAPVTLYGVGPTHRFDSPGTFEVTLNATDPVSLWATDTMTVTVYDVTAPVANAGPDQTVDEGIRMTFDGSESIDNLGIVNWTWAFYYYQVLPEHPPVILFGETAHFTFDKPDVYKVWLTVWDAAGHSHIDYMNVTVTDVTPPIANAGPDQVVDEGALVKFYGLDSYDVGGIVNYTWTFDYGEQEVSLHGWGPTYSFDIPGVYVVSLRVTDAAGHWGTDEMSVTVIDITAPSADAGPDQTVDEGSLVTFDGSDSLDEVGIVDHAWSFDTGTGPVVLHGISPTYTFDVPGVYIVTLTVVDAVGLRGEDDMTLTVTSTNVAPTATVTIVIPNPAFLGEMVTFSGEGNDVDGAIAHYLWESDIDGILGDVAIFETDALSPGDHTITLKVRDDDGDWSEPVNLVLAVRPNKKFIIRDMTELPTKINNEMIVAFRVEYTDPDNDAPTTLKLLFTTDDNWKAEPLMELDATDDNYVDGKGYYVNLKFEQTGKYGYIFEFENAMHPRQVTDPVEFKVEETSSTPAWGVLPTFLAIVLVVVYTLTVRRRDGYP